MTRKEYNGWTNYETWVVALWMDNEQGSQQYWADIAQESFDNAEPVYASQTIKERALCVLADQLKSEHEEALPELQGFAADLLNAAMSEVNWYEIAEHLLADLESEQAASNG